MFYVTRCISATCWSGGHLTLTYKKEKKIKVSDQVEHNALWGTVFHVVCSVVISNLICISSWKKCNNVFRLRCCSWFFLVIFFKINIKSELWANQNQPAIRWITLQSLIWKKDKGAYLLALMRKRATNPWLIASTY